MTTAPAGLAHGSLEIDDHLQQFNIPLGTRSLLIKAVAVRSAEGMTAESWIRQGYVAVRAGEARPIAWYVHRTQVSVALDPEVAESVARAHRFCVLEPGGPDAPTRYVKLKHADIRMYEPILGELLLVALQRSWDRIDLAVLPPEDPPSLAPKPAANGRSPRAPRPPAAPRAASPRATAPRSQPTDRVGAESSSGSMGAAAGALGGSRRTAARVEAPAPPPRPATPMCPIHFHPLINGECDYCA